MAQGGLVVGQKTAYNRSVYAHTRKAGMTPPLAARGSIRLGRCAPTAHYTHIFAVAGNLRFPLSQPQKRRIQPERYATCDRQKNTKYLVKY
jgi:hypothetical protein